MPRRPDMNQAHDKLFPKEVGERDLAGFKLIEHSQIVVKAQPRTVFPSEELTELADNIKALHEREEGIEGTGILQPLMVVLLDNDDTTNNDAASTHGASTHKTSAPSRYRLVAGERRYRASQAAGMLKLPVIVLPLQESTQENAIYLAQIIENLQRRDLPPLDEANALQRLMNDHDISVRETGKLLGKSSSYISDRTALLKMAPDVQAMLSQRTDTIFHAREIDRLEDAQLRSELIEATLEGLSVFELRQRIKQPAIETSSESPSENPPETSQSISEESLEINMQKMPSQHSNAEDFHSAKDFHADSDTDDLSENSAEHDSLENPPYENDVTENVGVSNQTGNSDEAPSTVQEVVTQSPTAQNQVSVRTDTSRDLASDLSSGSNLPANPIQLGSAVTLLTEAVRLLHDEPDLAREFRQDIESELAALEEQITQLKNAL